MIVPVFNYHSSIITIMGEKQIIIYQPSIKFMMCPEVDTKQHKKARFS